MKQNEKDGDFGYGWLKTNSAGSGAFKLRQWKANESLTLDANPAYWQGAPEMKRVILRHIAEPATQRLLLEKGDIDVARNLKPSSWTRCAPPRMSGSTKRPRERSGTSA